MDKIDWKRKLTSRKFWLALTAMVSGLILAFGGDEKTAETVCGCIMSVASVVAYLIAEGLTDAAGARPEDERDGIAEHPPDEELHDIDIM